MSSSGSTSRWIAAFACATSAALICAKSFFCKISISETVCRMSISSSCTSRCSFSPIPENSASCTRCDASLRLSGRPVSTCGMVMPMSCSR